MTNLTNNIKAEFESHAQDAINDGRLTLENKDEWHYLLFNEDYYIIGYYHCSEWLKKHNIDAFEAVRICQEYETENFGESTKVYGNSEVTVNMLVYVMGEEWLNEHGNEFIELALS